MTVQLLEPSSSLNGVDAIQHGLSEMESPLYRLQNVAYAIRMMASSDEIQRQPGGAMDTLADVLVDGLQAILDERERLWLLARGART